LEHAVAGTAGSVLATLLLFPLERLKTLQQIEMGMGRRELLQKVLQREGAGGLYRGCFPMLETVGTSNFLYFFLFEGLKEPLAIAAGHAEGEVGPLQTLAASAIAGSLNMVVTEPLWRACVVAQALSSDASDESSRSTGSTRALACNRRAGVFHVVGRMWSKEGPRALWRGLGSSLWLVMNPVIQYFVYDLLKALLRKEDISSIEAFIMGAIAKAVATVLTFPLQVAQSRMRVVRENSSADIMVRKLPELQGMVPCLQALFRKGGIRGLYSGLVSKLLQTVTTAAFMFAFYEKVHWAIRRYSRKAERRIARRIKALR